MTGDSALIKRKLCKNKETGCDLIAQIGRYCGRCKSLYKKKITMNTGTLKNIEIEKIKTWLPRWYWSDLYRQCANCHSTRYEHKRSGLCIECFTPELRKQIIRNKVTIHRQCNNKRS